MKFWYLLIIFIQAFVISFLGYKIYNRQNSVLGNKSINPILKSQINNNVKSILSYYYEPVINGVEKNDDWIPYTAKRTINADSFHEIRNYSVYKPDKTYRILTLGDSFTFGVFLNTEDNWTEKLEIGLNSDTCATEYEVINLGVAGYDIEYSVERYRLRGEKYNPDLVIWFLKEDDFEIWNEKLYEILENVRTEMTESGEIERLRNSKDFFPDMTEAWKRVSNTIDRSLVVKHQQAQLEVFRKMYKGQLLILTLPSQSNSVSSLILETKISEDNLFIHDLVDFYKNKSYYFPDHHPTTQGHTLIAEDVYSYLTKNNIVDCR